MMRLLAWLTNVKGKVVVVIFVAMNLEKKMMVGIQLTNLEEKVTAIITMNLGTMEMKVMVVAALVMSLKENVMTW